MYVKEKGEQKQKKIINISMERGNKPGIVWEKQTDIFNNICG